MVKFPLFLNGALVEGGRAMSKAEATRLIQALHGQGAKAVKTEGNEGGTQWRAIR